MFLATEGLTREFGRERSFDTPLSEDGIVGTAIGMALNGLRPVAEIQFQDFIFPAFDQIVSEAAKFRYRSGGQYPSPVVVRTPYGGGIRGGDYHSRSPAALFVHTPGLVVACPSNPADAKGMLGTDYGDPEDRDIYSQGQIALAEWVEEHRANKAWARQWDRMKEESDDVLIGNVFMPDKYFGGSRSNHLQMARSNPKD